MDVARDAELIRFNPGLLLVKLVGALLVCALLFALAAWRVDVNLFSLHALYGNRLMRCYLGASNPKRSPDPLTAFDPTDDLRLAKLRAVCGGRAKDDQAYDGPYLLMNAALNLVSSHELAWQERKAESFLFSPLRCGSKDTGYCDTAKYANNLRLATAMTISGAAASPNAGAHSSPPVTALLTVFNARLGAWLGNPMRASRRNDQGPKAGFLYLIKELFGWTTSESSYVYLSDGGHFENLAVYELVRRRCRYIVAVDAGCDPDHRFEDLGNLIRKCRSDFGIPIEIDLATLQRSPEARQVRWHCAIGKIRYDYVDFGVIPGTLIYLKPSLTGDEPADIVHYAAQHAEFPHETTADQFYTESQFESYRALGHHVAEAVFSDSVDEIRAELEKPRSGLKTSQARAAHRKNVCRGLFSSLMRRWFAMPPRYESSFIDSTEGFMEVQKSFAEDPQLQSLTFAMYPELRASSAKTIQKQPEGPAPSSGDTPLPSSTAGPADKVTPVNTVVHTFLRMGQVLENAWLSLNLEANYAHPLNRGWLDVFERWTNVPEFREFWPMLRSEFSRGFVSFCEKQMRVGQLLVELKPAPGQPIPDVLTIEFDEEWPQYAGQIDRLLKTPDAMAWLISARMVSPPALGQAASDAVAPGIIIVWPEATAPKNEATAPKNDEKMYGLFVWIRGPYRNSGLGRRALSQLGTELRSHEKFRSDKAYKLRVRLPVGEITGPGGNLLLAMWRTFFHSLDFVQIYEPAALHAVTGKEKEIVLDRTITSE